MELVVRKNDLLRELQLFQGIVERKNTFRSSPTCCRGEGRRSATSSQPISKSRLRSQLCRDGHQARLADAAGEETLRDRQVAARHRHSDRRRQERRQSRGRSLRLADADAAARRLSDPSGRRRSRRQRRCRAAALKEMVAKTQFAITGEDTRFFLNGASSCCEPDIDEPGGDRWPPAGAGDGRSARATTRRRRRESKRSCRRRRWANWPGC